jgi:hypothetical protein cdiviTM7_02182
MLKVLRSRNREFRKAVFIGVPVVALIVFSALAVIRNISSAVRATDFNPGRIIDDSVFYDKDSMNVQQIQAFLNSQVGQCDTWGSGPSGRNDGRTAAQFAAAQRSSYWHQPPYVCINNYHENPNTGETSFEKGGGAFNGGISAAQIIYNAAQEYGISPKVLLVLLKKESQNVLNDNWPVKGQYKYAMGYGCPDSGPNYTAACVNSKAGFYKQMTLAAWQLKYYKDHYKDGGYSLRIGWNNIQYSPNPACGTKRVNIENVATLSLYIYTPYVPNDAALANFPGTANCGAYGNRNFFMFYNQLFGSTTDDKVEIVKSNVALPKDSYAVSANSSLNLDIENGAINSNGARIQIYAANSSKAQQFSFEQTDDGYYVIRNLGSGKVLDVAGGRTINGASVQLYDYNGTCAQKWALSRKPNGKIEILSKCNGNKALDIVGGNINSSGAKLQLYSRNDTPSQEFNIKSLSQGLNGTFKISNFVSNKVIGIKNEEASAHIVDFVSNSPIQQFEIKKYDGVFYKIKSISSGSFLEITENVNAKQLRFNHDRQNSCEQLWSIHADERGAYKIQNACSGGFVIDVVNGAINTSGSYLQGYSSNNTDAQRWKIEDINTIKALDEQISNSDEVEGKHVVSTMTTLAMDIASGRMTNGANLQIYNQNKTLAQNFTIEKTSDNLYVIRSDNGKVIDVSGGRISNGTKLQLYDYNGTCAQKWKILKSDNGLYEILSACDSNKTIDVSGGMIGVSGTKLQLYSRNQTLSQQWKLKQ